MELSKEQVKEVAELLDCGMICYIHKETKEIKSLIDFDETHADPDGWEEEIEEIENNFDKYVKIEKMSSREAFQIMEDFVDVVSNRRIKERLINALNRRKPFSNFKREVDYNEEVRQQWFKFKAYKYEDWVIDTLRDISEEEEEETLEQNPPMIMGYFNDDGTPFNPGLHPLPSLCMSCKKRNNPHEEMLCNLTRMDQMGEKEFKCFAYENLNE